MRGTGGHHHGTLRGLEQLRATCRPRRLLLPTHRGLAGTAAIADGDRSRGRRPPTALRLARPQVPRRTRRWPRQRVYPRSPAAIRAAAALAAVVRRVRPAALRPTAVSSKAATERTIFL